MTDTFYLGAVVPLTFYTYDSDGNLVAPGGATLTITKPDGTTATPTMTDDGAGTFTLDYTPAAVGRYVAAFVSTGAGAGATVDVFDVLDVDLSAVTLADVKAYLGETSESDEQITAALDAERAAQSAMCDVDDYGHDLREALKRRVARNLAARSVPVATFTSFEGGGTSTRVPMVDAEIARLEAPYRRWVVA